MVLISSVVVLVALLLIYRTWADWPLSPVGLFVLSFMLSYGIRMAIIGFGLDSEYPDNLFRFGSPMLTANVYLLLFLLFVATGLVVGSQVDLRLRFVFPASNISIDPRRAFRIATVLTGIWFLIMVALLARYHSFSGLVRASKVDKQLAGFFALLVFPSAGSITSLLTFFLVLRERVGRFTAAQRRTAGLSIVYALFNGLGVYYWGARSLLVLIAVQIVIGYFTFRPTPARRRLQGVRPRVLLAIAVSFGLGVTLVFGLRIYRDQAISGEVSGSINGQSVVRQLSVAANTVHYDAYLLAVRDWPSKHRFRGGVDIYNGAVGVIPRAVWAGKPTFVTPGAWFRQVYEPKTRNGWPMGSAGVWYLNFGRVGLAIGGLLTGLVVAAASRSMSSTRTNPLAFVLAFSIGFWVIGDGVDGEFIVKWAQFVLPMFFLLPLMRKPSSVALPVAVGS
jgi:hypothetical protein